VSGLIARRNSEKGKKGRELVEVGLKITKLGEIRFLKFKPSQKM
jgi:hypothetical protein